MSETRRKPVLSYGTYDYVITVRTGDRPRHGTNAIVDCILKSCGKDLKKVTLNVYFDDDFEPGQMDEFIFKNLEFADVDSIEIITDITDGFLEWNIEAIVVNNTTLGKETVYPVFRQIRPDRRYTITAVRTCLPQYDEHKDERQQQLEEKRKNYELAPLAPGLQPTLKQLPKDDNPTFAYKLVRELRVYGLYLQNKVVGLMTGKVTTMDDMRKLYNKMYPYQVPQSTTRWEKDIEFGQQRLSGMNNCFIRLCEKIPEKIGVTDEMLLPFLEGKTLPVAIDKHRIFIADYEILKDCQVRSGRVVPAPIVLFYQRNDGNLVPIAIQLKQDKAENNPVFLPSDPKYTWVMAKMWVNVADSHYHQAIVHLADCHLMMGSLAVITQRNLSESHPLFRLLAPHFFDILPLNEFLVKTLLDPNGVVSVLLSMGLDAVFETIKLHKQKWRLNVEGTLPADLKARGVYDSDILPQYHFRDDALLVFDCIRNYVTDYVTAYYKTDDVIIQDDELQAWRREMVQPYDNGGLGLRGIPGENAMFTNKEHVIQVLTYILYTCSVSHEAVNAKQYDEYAFPPNYTTILSGNLPTTKAPLTEKEVVEHLPSKSTTLYTMFIGKVNDRQPNNLLGDFDVNYISDPRGLDCVKKFRANLKRVSEKIQERNTTRDPPYPFLDPAHLPNAIGN